MNRRTQVMQRNIIQREQCKTHNPGGQKNTSDAKVYHIEGTMQNTQSGWTEEHKLYKITIPIGGKSIKSTQNKAGDISDTKVVVK